MAKHVMVDLETLGNRPLSAIAAIGAVEMDFENFTLGKQFYTRVNPESATAVGMRIDASTVGWWLAQPEAARKELVDDKGNWRGDTLQLALVVFAEWLSPGEEEDRGNDVCVWGMGASFDPVILRQSFIESRIMEPWPFWGDRCARTIMKAYPDVERVRPDIPHHALHDAVAQAKTLLNIAKARGRGFD